MHSEVSQPHPLMPSKFEKTQPSRKPRNLLQSDEQCPGAPLSHLRKIPSATSGSNKGVKIVRKALSGAIARHSGDGKFYASLTMKLWSGANFWHQFRARPLK